MIIHTTAENILKALDRANQFFDGNLQFNKLQPLSGSGKRWRVTLRVKHSRGKGARLGFPRHDGRQRHLISACWHAHGRFFDALPAGTKIVTRGEVIYAGDEWKDFNIGSILAPYYCSEACECEM